MGIAYAGVCPRCHSADTEVAILSEADGKVCARCNSCGFSDMPVSSSDLELSVEVARRAFSTVVMADGEVGGGVPTVGEISKTLSMAATLLCDGRDCTDCPLRKVDLGEDFVAPPSSLKEPGGMVALSPLGLRCSDMNAEYSRNRLALMYPGLPA